MFALLDFIAELAVPILIIVIGLNRVKNEAAKKSAQRNRGTANRQNRDTTINQQSVKQRMQDARDKVNAERKGGLFDFSMLEEVIRENRQQNNRSQPASNSRSAQKTVQRNASAQKQTTTKKQMEAQNKAAQAKQVTIEELRAADIQKSQEIQQARIEKMYESEQTIIKPKRKKTRAQKAIIHYEVFGKPKSMR